jgi:hypothetical protein
MNERSPAAILGLHLLPAVIPQSLKPNFGGSAFEEATVSYRILT